MKIRITKLKEADNPLHPNNIEQGFVREGEIDSLPKVGQCFLVISGTRYFLTSTVQEIIDQNTFRTHNSIYHWEEIDEFGQA